MELTTLKELRELAKKLGLQGYARLTKSELQRRLGKSKTAAARVAAPEQKSPKARSAKPPVEAAHSAAPRPDTISDTRISSQEELVESMKFSPFTAVAPVTRAPDLGENIDRLPSLRQSTLCLLPQKPGVLHAYWALADGDGGQRDLKLRLCHGEPQALQVWDEVAIAARRGHWYFHVPETAESEVLIQLGYYDGDTFVTAIRRGIARIPSLYAAARTDRWWWISEEDFQRMYLRAGGALRGPGLGWSASIGSSPVAPWRPEERLGWPGGVSSRSK